jgi:hypothetical protein
MRDNERFKRERGENITNLRYQVLHPASSAIGRLDSFKIHARTYRWRVGHVRTAGTYVKATVLAGCRRCRRLRLQNSKPTVNLKI